MKIPQNEISGILLKRLAEIKKGNPSFSLRGFAKKLNINSGVLSLIVNGKRNISEGFAIELSDALALSEDDRKKFLASFEIEKKLRNGLVSREINDKVLGQMSNWYILAILSLVKLDNFENSPEHISARLGISKKEAVDAIEFLIDNKLLTLTDDHKLVRTENNFKTPDNIPSEKLKNIQANNLKMGLDSIYKDDLDKRDFTAMTIAVDPKNITYAKELIRKFERDLGLLLEHGEKKEVYKLIVGLFPLTR